MKKLILVIFVLCTSFSIIAQEIVTGNFYNIVEELLVENSLKKDNMTAQDFNIAGMYFYEKNLWYEAEIMFYLAIELDSRHVLAPYNLACVLSITFTDKSARHHSRLYDDESTPFAYLNLSVELDSNRRTRARNDPDLNNIRNYDRELFDIVTLPENQRERYTHEGIYIEPNSFEGDISVIFKIGNEELWLDGRDEKIKELDLYYIPEDSMPAYAVANEEKIGKMFEIVIIFVPGYSSYRGGYHLYKTEKVISIREL
jgi:hypothetical protein